MNRNVKLLISISLCLLIISFVGMLASTGVAIGVMFATLCMMGMGFGVYYLRAGSARGSGDPAAQLHGFFRRVKEETGFLTPQKISAQIQASQPHPSAEPAPKRPAPSVAPQPTRARQMSFTEKQWAALTSALRTPSKANLPKAKPGQALPAPKKTDSQLQADLLDRQEQVGKMLAKWKSKKQELHIWVQANSATISPEGLVAIFQMDLLLDAIQLRFDTGHTLVSQASIKGETIQKHLDALLELDQNALKHVSTGNHIRPLPFNQWEQTLISLERQIQKQRSSSGTSDYPGSKPPSPRW